MITFITILVSLVAINIALDEPLDKINSKWVSNFCVEISITIIVIMIFIVITVCIIGKEKDEVAKKIIEIDIIQDELERRKELEENKIRDIKYTNIQKNQDKINRNRRIHDNMRR